MNEPNKDFKTINLGSYDPISGHGSYSEYSQRIVFPPPPHRTWLQWQILYIKRFLSKYLGIDKIINEYGKYKHRKFLNKIYKQYQIKR